MRFLLLVGSVIAAAIETGAFSSLSSFAPKCTQFSRRNTCRQMGLTMYDHFSNDEQTQKNNWNVLAHTERWISDTLSASEEASGNPYSRKEVQYMCETSRDSSIVVASIFKRLREAREMGEHHGVMEEEYSRQRGAAYHAHTMRQTHVMVLPGNEHISHSFEIFDQCVNAINSARRNAKDYVTDAKLNDPTLNSEVSDWSIHVNCAHLHPQFGVKSFREMMMYNPPGPEEQEMQRKRLMARQSPYPTIVVEVRSEPPADFGNTYRKSSEARPKIREAPDTMLSGDLNQADVADSNFKKHRKEILHKEITAFDIQELEAIFSMPAATSDNESGDGNRFGMDRPVPDKIEEFGPSLVAETQKWIQNHDAQYEHSNRCSFAESDLTEVDQAYEFVFNNMAQHTRYLATRQYLVMPRFLSHSATSLENFTAEVMRIIRSMPDLKNKLHFAIFHPESVDTSRRSPVPVVVMQWV